MGNQYTVPMTLENAPATISSWTRRILTYKGSGAVVGTMLVLDSDGCVYERWDQFTTGHWRRSMQTHNMPNVVSHKAIARRAKHYSAHGYTLRYSPVKLPPVKYGGRCLPYHVRCFDRYAAVRADRAFHCQICPPANQVARKQ